CQLTAPHNPNPTLRVHGKWRHFKNLEWPKQSLALNLVENLWRELKPVSQRPLQNITALEMIKIAATMYFGYQTIF
uniref:Tc1-like transposase DDE domain-containing protein n=1 Tax=Oryzias latipes TaxID=8090 RepID=A0A3P9LXC7_ORYLA